MDKNEITGIVLAGGLSSRMGTDKGLLLYKGKRMVEYAIDILKLHCNEILISTNNSAYKDLGYPLIPDTYKNKGPLGGIHAALRASKNRYNLFLSCDMPHINTEAIEVLIQNINPNVWGLIPKYGETIEPMCGIYSQQLITEIEERLQQGNLKLRQFILEQPIEFVDFKKLVLKYNNLFSNMNSKSDLMH